MPDLFLKRGFPNFYEGVLRLPVIRRIRRQEQETLRRVFVESLLRSDNVLEVGAGTGFYTCEIAGLVRTVVALERATGMTRILKQRIASSLARNISVVESDFLLFSPAGKFDVVVAIGVLDSVFEWRPFLDRCISLAARCVILTIPRSSFWARIHSFFGGMLGVRIHVYDPNQFEQHLRGRRFRLYETGLQTRWTHGLTLVALIETDGAA